MSYIYTTHIGVQYAAPNFVPVAYSKRATAVANRAIGVSEKQKQQQQQQTTQICMYRIVT